MFLMRQALMRIIFLSAVLAHFFLSRPLFADIVHFKNGNQMEGEVVDETPEAIRLRMQVGTIGIARAEILEIEEKPYTIAAPEPPPEVISPAVVIAEHEVVQPPTFFQNLLSRIKAVSQDLPIAFVSLISVGLLLIAAVFLQILKKKRKQKEEDIAAGKMDHWPEETLKAYIRSLDNGKLLEFVRERKGVYRQETAVALAREELKARNVASGNE